MIFVSIVFSRCVCVCVCLCVCVLVVFSLCMYLCVTGREVFTRLQRLYVRFANLLLRIFFCNLCILNGTALLFSLCTSLGVNYLSVRMVEFLSNGVVPNKGYVRWLGLKHVVYVRSYSGYCYARSRSV